MTANIKTTPVETMEFTDCDGSRCVIQTSSVDKEAALWIGDPARADDWRHFRKQDIRDIVDHLTAWLATGSLRVTR